MHDSLMDKLEKFMSELRSHYPNYIVYSRQDEDDGGYIIYHNYPFWDDEEHSRIVLELFEKYFNNLPYSLIGFSYDELYDYRKQESDSTTASLLCNVINIEEFSSKRHTNQLSYSDQAQRADVPIENCISIPEPGECLYG